MKNKIEVGEYIRTKDGRIDKVDRYSIGCCVYHCKNGMCIDECETVGIPISDIKKHSSNITDLIEVGDYINGHKIVSKIWGEDDNDLYFEIEGSYHKATCIGEKDIKSIVTKEQFKSIEYDI